MASVAGVTASETNSTTSVTQIDLGSLGKYIKTETKTTVVDVDVTGSPTGAMENAIKNIKKTTTETISYQKVVSHNSDRTIDLSFSQNDNYTTASVSIENIPLSKKYEDNLKKVSPELAAEVDADVQTNKDILMQGIKAENDMMKDFEKKVNDGKLIRTK